MTMTSVVTGTFKLNSDGYWELHVKVDAVALNGDKAGPIFVVIDGHERGEFTEDFGVTGYEDMRPFVDERSWQYSGAIPLISYVISFDDDNA